MELKETFSKIPELYDEVRLSYPAALYRTIRDYAELEPNDPLLEIGTGTGKATVQFAREGNPITAIDLSKELIAVAKKNLKFNKKIKYIARPFEKVILPKNHYALAFSGQTFHWIHYRAGFKKIHDALKPNGTVAFFWNMHNYPKSPFEKEIRRLHVKHNTVHEKKMASRTITRLRDSSLFTDQTYQVFPWVKYYSKKQYLELLQSFSSIINLPPLRKERFLADVKKVIKKYPSPLRLPMECRLILAKK